MWGHRRYQSSSSRRPLRLSFIPHLPSRLFRPSTTILFYTLNMIVRRCRTNPFFDSPRILASRCLSLTHSTVISLRSIYYTSFSLPFPVRWFVFLVYPPLHDQIKRRRSRKSRWWKDLGLVCHHRLTADEREWELGMGSIAGTRWNAQDLLDLSQRRIKTCCCLPRGQFLYEKAN